MNKLYSNFLIRTIQLFCISFFIFATSICLSQEAVLSGKVVDEKSEPIPFANIISVNKKAGTFSRENGEFYLSQKGLKDTDVIEISFLGYESKQILVKDLKIDNTVIKLRVKFESLEEVIVVSQKQLKTFKKGTTRTNTQLIRFTSSFIEHEWNEPGHEMGRRFNLGNKKTSNLKNISFYIKKNTFDEVILAVNIYNIKDDKPHQIINPKKIIVTANDQFTGWKKIDISDLNIIVKEDIIITVEFIKGAPFRSTNTEIRAAANGLYMLYNHSALFTPPMYTRRGLQNEWEINKKDNMTLTLTYQQ